MSDNPNTQGQQAAQGQPQMDFNALVDPKTGKLMGKYENPEELAKGYWNSVNEMNATKQRLEMAMGVIESLQKGGANPNPAPALSPYEQELDRLGIPISALDQLISERASKIAANSVETQLAPLLLGMQAREAMQTTFPDFQETEKAALEMVGKSPELKAQFETLLKLNQPKAALELAYYNYKQFGAKPTPNQETLNAKSAAGFPQQTSGGGRMSGVDQGVTQGELERAREEFYSTGDPSLWMQVAFKDTPLTYSEQMRAAMGGNR